MRTRRPGPAGLKLSLGLALAFAVAVVQPALADGRAGGAEAHILAELPQLPSPLVIPEGRDELSAGDIRHAVAQHLVALGLEDRKVGEMKILEDDLILIEIVTGAGTLVGDFAVDTVTAEILTRDQLRDRLIAGARQCGDYVAGNLLSGLGGGGTGDDIQLKLRRHMLGDGQSWAPWLGRVGLLGDCDDYRDGGPEMPDRQSALSVSGSMVALVPARVPAI